MVWKVKFTTRAENDLVGILKYLESHWSTRSAAEFVQNLDKKITHIKRFPHLGAPISEEKSVRRSPLTEQVTIYYKLRKPEIFILTLFDTRQNPERIGV